MQARTKSQQIKNASALVWDILRVRPNCIHEVATQLGCSIWPFEVFVAYHVALQRRIKHCSELLICKCDGRQKMHSIVCGPSTGLANLEQPQNHKHSGVQFCTCDRTETY